MPRLPHCAAIAFLFSLLLAAGAESAGPEARKLLGQGVHSLYQGQLPEAIESFNLASVDLPEDPRIYFFRGVAKSRSGQTAEAIVDFQRGAKLEALLGRQDIGRSLQRIQGYERIEIERYRQSARKLAKAGKLLPPEIIAEDRQGAQALPPNEVVVTEIPAEDDLPNDSKDPFSADSQGLLGRGPNNQTTETPTPPQPELNESDNFDSDLADDAFADDFSDENSTEDPFPDDPEVADQPANSGSSNSGALGAVFRAFTRSAMPISTQQGEDLLRGIQQNVPVPGFSNGPDANDFPPGNGGDPFGNEEEDPFGDGEDTFGSGNAEMAEDEDPFGNEDAEMADDEDPFGNEDAEALEEEDPFGNDDGDPFADDEDPFGN